MIIHRRAVKMSKLSVAKKAALTKATEAAQRKRRASTQLESPQKRAIRSTRTDDDDNDDEVFSFAPESSTM